MNFLLKYFITIFLFVLVIKSQIQYNNYNPNVLYEKNPGYGKTWMYFPDENDVPRVVKLTVPRGFRMFSVYPENVEYHLYTRKNPETGQLLEVDNITSLNSSNFDRRKPTKFMIHGWISKQTSPGSQVVKNNYLKMNDYNVILVNWDSLASNIIYPIPAMQTKDVGANIGNMINFLVENGVNLNAIHLIGHSLGAHVAGSAGASVKSGKVARVTGLDPALPGFELISSESGRLDSSDAEFVDVIHTCAGILGYYSPLGHVDIYPNGGVPRQPGCTGLPQVIEGCSHGRSWRYFAESILRPDEFIATACDNWSKFEGGECKNNSKINVGPKSTPTARGLFYLKTDPTSPFIFNFTKFIS